MLIYTLAEDKTCAARLNTGRIEGPPKRPRYHTAVMFEELQGGFNQASMVSRYASLSDGCTPDCGVNQGLDWCTQGKIGLRLLSNWMVNDRSDNFSVDYNFFYYDLNEIPFGS